ncbi:hypothetical protein C8R47DRAFT_1208155 [Mycena vitilis]|nr:hypothetical protein C8R47DRAFT_1208155 [Mycena vitilis]
MSAPPVPNFIEHEGFFLEAVVERLVGGGMIDNISDVCRSAQGVKRYRCYACGCSMPQPIWLPIRGGSFRPLDLFLANLFPNGYCSLRISRVPGTDIPLPSAYRVYFASGKFLAPVNQCLMSRFNIKWAGNVLMVKHRQGVKCPAQVRREEDEYADILLALWLREFVYVRSLLGIDV